MFLEDDLMSKAYHSFWVQVKHNQERINKCVNCESKPPDAK